MSELIDSAALRYLRRIRYASRATGGKSLLLQKTEKDSHESDCRLPMHSLCLKLFELYSRAVRVRFASSALCALLGYTKPPREQPSAARLCEHRLARSRLSAPDRCATAQKQKISPAPKKQKKTATKVTVFFWRSRRDLNSRAGYPTYTLSRGASSPLEYYSKPMI